MDQGSTLHTLPMFSLSYCDIISDHPLHMLMKEPGENKIHMQIKEHRRPETKWNTARHKKRGQKVAYSSAMDGC